MTTTQVAQHDNSLKMTTANLDQTIESRWAQDSTCNPKSLFDRNTKGTVIQCQSLVGVQSTQAPLIDGQLSEHDQP